MKKDLLIALLTLSIFSLNSKGQDHIYSQFYNAPIYLNPALTGQFEGDLRVNMIYRNQWTGLAGDLSYISASVDVQVPQFGGGFGLMFTRSSEGIAYLVKNNIAGTYAYSIGDDNFVASFGLQIGLTNRRIDWDNLVFSDQIDRRLGIIPGNSSAELPDVSNKYYFDAVGGINIVYRNIMLGAAVFHLNKPDESFTGVQAKLPMRLTANASMRFPIGRSYQYNQEADAYIIPSVVYHRHDKFTSVSIGGQLKYRSVNAGIWYRGNSQGEPDALVLSAIFDIFNGSRRNEKLRIGISHDATLSKLNYTNTSGTTEASIGFEKFFPNSDAYNKFNSLRCYDFY